MNSKKTARLAGLILLSACLIVGIANSASCGEKDSFTYEKLVWKDEFGGKSLSKKKWRAMIGTGEEEGYPDRWGNNEEQYYTAENVQVKDGYLLIKVKREAMGGMDFTSARITTSGLYSLTYGRVEARMKLPSGTQGIWPAFWLLPDGEPSEWKYGAWAASGEIDIMEYKSRLPREISGALHYGGAWPNNVYSSGKHTFSKESGETAAGWHVYSLEWFEDKMIWYVDGAEYFRMDDWYSVAGDTALKQPAPFDQPFSIVINAAVGGNFDGGRAPSKKFTEAEILVDWVRVYQ